MHLMAFAVDPVVAVRLGLVGLGFGRHGGEQRRNRVHAHIEFGVIFGLPRNDQRRAGFIDEDRVDLVDHRKRQAALHAIGDVVDHVVAQVVEAEFVIGAVGDIRGIGLALEILRHLREVDADAQAQEAIDATHPVGIALGKVVVDRDHMHAGTGQRIEIGRQGGHQGLALAGAHFSDLAVMQRHAAKQLHIEVTHAEHAPGRLATDCEGLGEHGIKRLTLREAGAQLGRLGGELLIGQPG